MPRSCRACKGAYTAGVPCHGLLRQNVEEFNLHLAPVIKCVICSACKPRQAAIRHKIQKLIDSQTLRSSLPRYSSTSLCSTGPPSRRRSGSVRSAAVPCTSSGSGRTVTLPFAYTPSALTACTDRSCRDYDASRHCSLVSWEAPLLFDQHQPSASDPLIWCRRWRYARRGAKQTLHKCEYQLRAHGPRGGHFGIHF